MIHSKIYLYPPYGRKRTEIHKEAFDTNLAPLGPNDSLKDIKNMGENSLPEPCQERNHPFRLDFTEATKYFVKA
jgi:hypothetical protein